MTAVCAESVLNKRKVLADIKALTYKSWNIVGVSLIYSETIQVQCDMCHQCGDYLYCPFLGRTCTCKQGLYFTRDGEYPEVVVNNFWKVLNQMADEVEPKE